MVDYEKKYKEALERARQIHSEQKAQCFDVMVKVFPELSESEDEKIRKSLIRHFSRGDIFDGLKCPDIVAWLEKHNSINDNKQKEITLVEVIDGEDLLSYSRAFNNVRDAEKFFVDELKNMFGNEEEPFSENDINEILNHGYHADQEHSSILIKQIPLH